MNLKKYKRISDIIDIEKLERETYKFLYLGFVVAVLIHGIASLFISYKRPQRELRRVEQRIYKPIPVRLIARPPRITNPYEFWRRHIGRRTLQRKKFGYRIPDISFDTRKPDITHFEMPRDRYYLYIDTESLIQPFIISEPSPEIKAEIDPERFKIVRIYQDMTISKDPYKKPHKISLRDELIAIKDLDYGKWMGVAVMNPHNKENLKGFIHIPVMVWGKQLRPPENIRRAISGLSEGFTKLTSIELRTDKHVQLESPDLLKYPFIYIAADDAFDLSELEKKNLGEYLRNGGFAFIEAYGFAGDLPQLPPKGADPLKTMLKDVLGAAGNLDIIPNDHFLYHCFYDFDDGPPRIERRLAAITAQPSEILEGVWIDDRIVAVYSEKSYGTSWSDISVPETYHKIGVNLIVFALLQHGGISLKVIDDIAYTQ